MKDIDYISSSDFSILAYYFLYKHKNKPCLKINHYLEMLCNRFNKLMFLEFEKHQINELKPEKIHTKNIMISLNEKDGKAYLERYLEHYANDTLKHNHSNIPSYEISLKKVLDSIKKTDYALNNFHKKSDYIRMEFETIWTLERRGYIDIKHFNIYFLEKEIEEKEGNYLFKHYTNWSCILKFNKSIDEILEEELRRINGNKLVPIKNAPIQIENNNNNILRFISKKNNYTITLNPETRETFVNDSSIKFRDFKDKQYIIFKLILEKSINGEMCSTEKMLGKIYKKAEIKEMDKSNTNGKKNKKSKCIEEKIAGLRKKLGLNNEKLKRDNNLIMFQ